MDVTVLSWLQSIGWSAFTWALGGVLLVNGVALLAFIWKGERSLVNAWTGPVLAINIVLVAIGIGVPMVTSVARLAIIGMRGVIPGISMSSQ
ncbi:hypothetical protein [Gemmatimonas sp.]|uniref:hypothetical protein n=1 Tax=Gemmatimonas sp. TaxID=1962908 RepID=UPI00286E322E|nr:hypothetical protein [Gemmatimonas sp.]